MILKQSRDGKTVATYETEELAVKANHLSLALLRSHLNSKKPKYLDGFVYVAQQMDAADMLTGNPLEGLTEEGKKEVVEVTMGELVNRAAVGPETNDTEPLEDNLLDNGFRFTQEWTTKVGLETLGVDSVTVRRQSMHDLIETGVSIIHTDAVGNQRRVDPTSEEGEKVIELVQGEPPADYQSLDNVLVDGQPLTPEQREKLKQRNTLTDPIPDDLIYNPLPPDDDFEPSPPGEEQGFDLRKIAKQRLSPDDADLPPVETDFNLTPMQKRAKELKKRPPL